MKLIRNIAFLALAVTPLYAQEAAERWTVDKSHSSTTFRVRHMMASVPGSFRDFEANVDIDRANPSASRVEFTIQTASIDTANANRDEHLRSPDFFDAAKYPTITFKSTSVQPKSKTEYVVTGDLTIRGITKRVTLPVTHLGFARDGRGREKAGFELETTIDRKDFGIVWNRALDEGGVLLGDEVKVAITLQVAKKMPEAPAPAK